MNAKIKAQIHDIIEDCRKTISLTKILDWDIPSMIYLYIRTHGELSLSQLANSLGKSKTTIKRHLMPMLEKNLVKEREFKKAYYYQLDSGLLQINTPLNKFIGPDSSKKTLFKELLDNMSEEQIHLVNQASFSVYQIIFKILRKTLDETMTYLDVHASMPPNKDRILEISKSVDLTVVFTALNKDNKEIFDKHWGHFMENYNQDIYSHKSNTENIIIPNFDSVETSDLAWHFMIPVTQMFKIK